MKSQQNASYKSIETHLQDILDNTDSHIWTIKDLFQALKGKGYPFLIILLSLPFCQPFQIPGFSTPFGIVLIFIGLRMAFGRRVWWPQWVLNQTISPKLLKIVIKNSLGFFRFLRPFLKTRWTWLTNGSIFYHIHGGFVILMGVYLALPLPIPLSNMLAAWSLFILGLGLIEDDGLFVCVSYVIGLIALVLLIYIVWWVHAWAVH